LFLSQATCTFFPPISLAMRVQLTSLSSLVGFSHPLFHPWTLSFPFKTHTLFSFYRDKTKCPCFSLRMILRILPRFFNSPYPYSPFSPHSCPTFQPPQYFCPLLVPVRWHDLDSLSFDFAFDKFAGLLGVPPPLHAV